MSSHGNRKTYSGYKLYITVKESELIQDLLANDVFIAEDDPLKEQKEKLIEKLLFGSE